MKIRTTQTTNHFTNSVQYSTIPSKYIGTLDLYKNSSQFDLITRTGVTNYVIKLSDMESLKYTTAGLNKKGKAVYYTMSGLIALGFVGAFTYSVGAATSESANWGISNKD